MKNYKEVNGTFYDVKTIEKVVKVLEDCRLNETRIVLDYGDIETGRTWGDVYDITGRVGRSTGNVKIPLLIHNIRSMGGPSILDHCIIGIKESKGGKVLYSYNQ
tara:strand:+ start:19 stop:330 length:312 start_codon:yes stop_codon:yes gene_type:complete